MDYDQIYRNLAKEPKRWNIDDVAVWLELIGLSEYNQKFSSNSIDGALLTVLNENDLIEIGIIEKSKSLQTLLNWISNGFQEYSQYLKDQAIITYSICQDKQFPMNKHQDSSVLSTSDKKSGLKAVKFQCNVNEGVLSSKIMEPTQVSFQHTLINDGLTLIAIFDKSKQYNVLKEDFTIGRNYDNSLVMIEDYISRQHCKIIFNQHNQQYYVQDVGSSSGTYIQLNNATLLQESIILQMGLQQYRIEKIQVYGQICSVQIRILEGELLNKTFDFELIKNRSTLIFGRNLTLFQFDSNLSNEHAQFAFVDEGLIVEDLGSRNGTWLRLSLPRCVSEPIKIINNRIFRLAYEKIFQCLLN